MSSNRGGLIPQVLFQFDEIDLPSCSLCDSPTLKVIEYYDKDDHPLRAQKLCPECLNGKRLPLFSQSHHRWGFVEVRSYDEETCRHEVIFPNGNAEMVDISESPFLDYVSHVRESNKKKTTVEQNILHVPNVISSQSNIEHLQTVSVDEQDNKSNLVYLNHHVESPKRSSTPCNRFYSRDTEYRTTSSTFQHPRLNRSNMLFENLSCDSVRDSPPNFNHRSGVVYPKRVESSYWKRLASCLSDGLDDDDKNFSVANNGCNVKSAKFISCGDLACKQDSKNNSHNAVPYQGKGQPSSKESVLHHPRIIDEEIFSHTHTSAHIIRKISLNSEDEYEPKPSHENKFRKPLPKLWTFEEDEALLNILRKQSEPIKWPIVAQNLPTNRSGKQCRERFLNHLNPNLKKSSQWSSFEDVTILNLYCIFGAQWAKIASLISGRTDNNVKNRFHHLRRKLEKDYSNSLQENKLGEFGRKMQSEFEENFLQKRESTSFQRKLDQIVGFTVAKVIETNETKSKEEISKSFQSEEERFRRAKLSGEQCKRCYLFLPSKQCGTKVCKITGWCETCCQISPYVCRDSLYHCFWLIGEKRSGEMQMNSIHEANLDKFQYEKIPIAINEKCLLQDGLLSEI